MQTLTSLVGVCDDESHSWYRLEVSSSQSSHPSARVGHSLIYGPNENCVFCIGGADPGGLSQSLYKLDLNSLMWEEMSSVGFKFRYEHSAFVSKVGDRSHLYVFGGADTSENRNDLQMWDSDDQQWKNIAPKGVAPSPRTQHSCAVANGLHYVFSGGAVGTEPVSDTSVFVFDPKKNIWTSLESTGTPPCARQGHCMVVIKNRIYIHGGMNGEDFYDDLYVLDTTEKNWISLDPSGPKPSPRAAHGAVAVGADIYIFGGLGCEGALNDFFRFCTEFGYWQKIEIGEDKLPLPRLDFAMCCVKISAPSEVLNQSPSLSVTRNSGTNEDQLSPCHGSSEKLKTRAVILLHGGMDTSGNIFDDVCIYLV